nr:carnitine O-acetyltransferase-like [Ciona intestinalis]|eukprot:XP_009861511.1 carnitine O-acetyltransferase-like [Ciona intestinalis]
MIYSKLRPHLVRHSLVSLHGQLVPKHGVLSVPSSRFYSHQESLPNLPVPTLQQTLDKYLKTVTPLVNESEFNHTQKLVQEFGKANGIGEKLQELLLQHADKKENWLSDWWLDEAYLKSRASVVIHCSPSVSFPKYKFSGVKGQVEQAAKVVAAILDYKVNIDNETLPVEMLGGKPLCMDQYYRILSSCRIPGIEKDGSRCYARSWRPPRHITVICKNKYFELEVYNRDRTPLTIRQLETQLSRIVTATNGMPRSDPVGILTSEDRDTWGSAYQTLMEDRQNQASVRSIQRSIFALCLDERSSKVSENRWRSDMAGRCLHGGGSQYNTGNRWFDKTVQMIVDQDGGVGLAYEHSPAEGPPIAALLDHVYKYCDEPITQPRSSILSLPHPKFLPFNIKEDTKMRIENASMKVDSLINNLTIEVLNFKDFGKDFIKSQKLSPDSFFQIALQLAYYTLHNKPPATYESASLRRFRLGRTDTIRSCSSTSQAFTEAVVSGKSSVQDLAAKLRDAVAAHRAYTVCAVSGNGIDRHLLGLRLIATKSGLETPEIYNDPTYKKAMSFNLSTSQVPCKADLCMAFGPAVNEGYGVCYNPKNNKILVSISVFNTIPEYNTVKFKNTLISSLQRMKDILVAASPKL